MNETDALRDMFENAAIETFEFDNQWYASVEFKGSILHTTEGYEDEDSARWTAQDWCNAQLSKLHY